jgi:hypothetical protein
VKATRIIPMHVRTWPDSPALNENRNEGEVGDQRKRTAQSSGDFDPSPSSRERTCLPSAVLISNPATSPARSLKGAKAGRIVRALIDRSKPPGVRELASLAQIDAGYVSRVLALLDTEALITRDAGPRSRE